MTIKSRFFYIDAQIDVSIVFDKYISSDENKYDKKWGNLFTDGLFKYFRTN